jgi:uncharacterized protein (TIGR03000 family)
MYALVLMTAMSPGADVTPAPAPRPVPVAGAPVAYGYGGMSTGCTGYAYGSCYGSFGGSFGGCYGSCHGCHGGGLFGHHRASCHGGGYSCNGYNCFGSCHGFGVMQGTPFSCHGGCYGGYYGGGSMYGPPAIYGDPYAVYGTVNRPPVMVVPAEPKSMEKPSTDSPVDKDKDKDKPKGMGAKLKFQLPADAKLYVDGRPTAIGGTERAFTTPPLAPGQKFFYEVRAELVMVTGVVSEEKRVIVEAGADITESFAKLLAAVGK